MSDDLFERLRIVDPATEERIAQEARALGTVPGRIAETEPSNVRRFPKAARRKATLAAVAAVVVVAIAVPLTLLRSLGEGGGDPVAEPGNWVRVGTLTDIRDRGVVYDEATNAFLVAKGEGDPLALWAATGESPVAGDRLSPRALYCESDHTFVDPGGDVFDQDGSYHSGPVQRGLGRFPVRVVDGTVQIDTSEITPSGSSNEQRTTAEPGCLTTNGIPFEGRPGFAIAATAELAPIAVALPQSGMRVTSPVTIAGNADVFEATVNIRVLDGNGEVIAESFAMATCGTGCRGDFSTQVDVPIDAEQPGTIQVFEYSAKDGSMINTVEIPVTLVPDVRSEPKGLEGTWFDGNDVPIPNEPVEHGGSAMAVVRGSNHCQWESAMFMQVDWPIGAGDVALSGGAQFVRDPVGLFDDGALRVGYLSDTSLPSGAIDTGYHRGPWRLWMSPAQADDAVFLVNADTGVVERWGRATPPILCD